ncbi:MAG: hypothetical protein JSV03_00095 [Planctomycetota bacterium]|nr:MAG: hypothetical protein JSV03_00095 [Planctomycetota bacterium]
MFTNNLTVWFGQNAGQHRVAAEFAYNELGARTAATIHDGSTSSVLLTKEFEDAFQELGGTITFPGKVNVGDTDMPPLLIGIAVHPPDVLYFPIPKPESDFIAAPSVEVPGLEDTTLMDADGLR